MVLQIDGVVPAEGTVSKLEFNNPECAIEGKYVPGLILLSEDNYCQLSEIKDTVNMSFCYLRDPHDVGSKVVYSITLKVNYLQQRYVVIKVDGKYRRGQVQKIGYELLSPIGGVIRKM